MPQYSPQYGPNVRPPTGIDYRTMGIDQLRDLASRGDRQAQAVLDEARTAATRPPVPARESAARAQESIIDVPKLVPPDYRPPSPRESAVRASEAQTRGMEPMPTPEEDIQPQSAVDRILRRLGTKAGGIGEHIPTSIPVYTPESMQSVTRIDPSMHMGDYPPTGPAPSSPGRQAFEQALKPGYLRVNQPAPPMPANQAAQQDSNIPKVTPPAEQQPSVMDKLFGPDKQEAWSDLMRFGLALMKAGEAKPGTVVGPSLLGAVGEAGLSTMDYRDRRAAIRAKAERQSQEKALDREVKRLQIEETGKLRRAEQASEDAWRRAGLSNDRVNRMLQTYTEERKEVEAVNKDIMGLDPNQDMGKQIQDKKQAVHQKWETIRNQMFRESSPAPQGAPQDIRARYGPLEQHGPALRSVGPGGKAYYYKPKTPGA